MKSILAAFGQPEDEAIEQKMLSKAIASAQKREEGKTGWPLLDFLLAHQFYLLPVSEQMRWL